MAAVTERDLIELVAADDELGAGGTIPSPSGARRRGRIWRIVLLRLAAYVPLALALGYGSLRLVQATYRELTLPSDVVTPIGWRVISTVPRGRHRDHRHVGARRDARIARCAPPRRVGPVPRPGVFRGVGRHPAPAAVNRRDVRVANGRDGAGRRADRPRVRHRLGLPADRACGGRSGRTRRVLLLSMLTFVAIWSAGLLVAGLAAAWRSASWTVELVRARGTFGALRHGPTGEWQRSETSGSLERPA